MSFPENPPHLAARAGIALERARAAYSSLGNCNLCAHRCGVDRLDGKLGLCHAGPETHVFSAQVEVTDELEIIPTFAIALNGCDMRCDFCITGRESWNPHRGEIFDPPAMARKALQALKEGAQTIMILGGEPTIHLHSVLEMVAELPDDARLVWKTNGHESEESLVLLEDIFDVWVVDYKFGNDACANRLSHTGHYQQTVQRTLQWARQKSDLIIRHLLMPGHVDCCWKPVADWIAEYLPGVKVNLRSGFWPAWKTGRHPELGKALGDGDVRRAWQMAKDRDLNLIS